MFSSSLSLLRKKAFAKKRWKVVLLRQLAKTASSFRDILMRQFCASQFNKSKPSLFLQARVLLFKRIVLSQDCIQ